MLISDVLAILPGYLDHKVARKETLFPCNGAERQRNQIYPVNRVGQLAIEESRR